MGNPLPTDNRKVPVLLYSHTADGARPWPPVLGIRGAIESHVVRSTITDPEILRELGQQAEDRGRYHRAIPLYRQAAYRGNTKALGDLALLRKQAGDTAGAVALYRQAAEHGDPEALCGLARLRERAGDTAGAEVMYRQAADYGYPSLGSLADLREESETPPERMIYGDSGLPTTAQQPRSRIYQITTGADFPKPVAALAQAQHLENRRR
jgi:tetratricopeptide (TPR) repeat protein